MPPYVYKALKPPLEQIRLIRLLPGEYNDPIMLHMFHAPLSSPAAKPSTSTSMGIEAIQETLPKPWMVFKTVEGSYIYENQETEDTSWTHPDPTIRASMESVMAPVTFESKAEDDYEALSWVWGTSPTHELVYVEDQSRLLSEKSPDNDTYLEIRPNLAQALRHIRPLEKHRTLWIDAICINQKDNAERSAQVRIMGEIYSLAHRVVIWVGPAAKDSRLALDKLRYIGQQVKQCGKFYLLNAPDCIERSIWLGDLRISEAMARALCDLCDRSWFGRLWVLQEVQLSSTRTVLQCGQDQIDWSLFRRAIMILVINRASRPHPEPRPHFEPLLRLAYDMRERDFATLLLAATVMEATEPRDKIYALRNLADKGFRELIRPDYDRPVRMVFEDAVIACIRHDQNLRILIHCNPKDRIATPSWVPDWDHAQPVLPMLCATFASGLARCGIKYITGGVVELEGLQIQSVDLVGSVALPHSDMVAIFRSWEPPDLQTRSYGPGGAMIDAYLATLWLGMTKDYTEWSSAHPTLQECRDFYMYKVHGQIDTAGNGNLYAQHLLQMNIPRFHNRRFFRAGPYLGLGPGIVEPDDIVCVLLGSGFPIVLRRSSSSTYVVVGPCYVHGLGRAEALLGAIPSPWICKTRIDYQKDSSHSVENFLAFTNTSTGEVTARDPRLAPVPLPNSWEELLYKDTDAGSQPGGNQNLRPQRFRHNITGEVTNFDPRLEPDALRARGVDLETFRLV